MCRMLSESKTEKTACMCKIPLHAYCLWILPVQPLLCSIGKKVPGPFYLIGRMTSLTGVALPQVKTLIVPAGCDVPGVEQLVVGEALVEVVVGRPPAAHPSRPVDLLGNHVGRCEWGILWFKSWKVDFHPIFLDFNWNFFLINLINENRSLTKVVWIQSTLTWNCVHDVFSTFNLSKISKPNCQNHPTWVWKIGGISAGPVDGAEVDNLGVVEVGVIEAGHQHEFVRNWGLVLQWLSDIVTVLTNKYWSKSTITCWDIVT